MIRKPAFAGSFYPGTRKDLESLVKGYIHPEYDKKSSVAVISPHAGLVYSGAVAGAVFSSVRLPEKIILIGPNHRPMGCPIALMTRGVWESPLGKVPVDSDLANRILELSRPLSADVPEAHRREHSLEVQLPFIQYLTAEPKIVPIIIGGEVHLDDLRQLGLSVASAVRDTGEDILIVASTDMSHYVDQETAEKDDHRAIDRILAMDAPGLFETVRSESISMCGIYPTTATLFAAAELGAGNAELIKYQTSGEVSGDFARVVGYAGLRIFKLP